MNSSPLIRHKSDEEKLKLNHTWNEEAGQKVIRFIEDNLVLETGERFVVMPWMRDIIRSWYCWIRPDGLRSTKIGLLSCGRKNAKSILNYGLTLYHLIGEGIASPSCISVAQDKTQSGQIYDWIEYAINRNRMLQQCVIPKQSQKTIWYPAKSGRYVSVSSDKKNKLGKGHNFIFHDELAACADGPYLALKDAGKAKPNSIQIIASTAGWNKNGIFFKMVEDSRKILAGTVIDTSFQPWIFEVPEGSEDDESQWIRANPGLGITQSLDELRDSWNRDKRDPTTRLNAKILNWNQWTEAKDGWIAPEAYSRCERSLPDLTGIPCVLGLDVGQTRDLTAIALVFTLPDGRFAVKTWGFVPEGAFGTRDKINDTNYKVFAEQKSLTITEGTATDERKLCDFIDKLRKEYNIVHFTMDQHQSLTVSNHLLRSLPKEKVSNFSQTHTMYNAPCLMLERLINSEKIIFEPNALLRWQVGHTFLDRNSHGYVKPETIRKENKKDNLCAILMALSLSLSSQAAIRKPSIYASRPVYWG